MQTFDTREFDHHFVIDGQEYWLPGIQMGDLVFAGSLSEIEDNRAKVEAFRDFMISRVRSDRKWFARRGIGKAVRSLNPVQLTQLFSAWSTPGTAAAGEASGSQVSTADTDAS